MDSGERFLAEPALEYVDIVAGRGESVAYGIDMGGPLSENETGPASVECLHDVCADLSGASLVFGERAEDLLNRGGVVVVDEACGMDDQSALDELRVEQVTGPGLVAGRAAL